MKTRILLCAGLLAIGTTMTLDSNTVMAKGLIQSDNRLVQKNVLTSEEEAEYYYRLGKEMLERGDNQTAIECFTATLQLNRYFYKALSNRAFAKSKLGNYSGAADDYELSGVFNYDRGNYQDAMADYTRAIKLKPINPPYFGRGNAKDKLGDYSGAIADYNRAIEINPNYADAYNNRGLIRKKLGDHSGAIADFNRALAINPDHEAALKNLVGTNGGSNGAARRAREQNTLDHINRVRNAQTCCK